MTATPARTLQGPLFATGQIVVTAGVKKAIDSGKITNARDLLNRHRSGDWGEMDEEDKATNEQGLKYGTRLMSEYATEAGRLWVITEANRSVTTFLFPSEY